MPAGTSRETRFRVLKVSAVTEGIFNPLMSKPVPDGYVPPDDHLVRAGDLLISRANTSRLVGATAIVEHAVPNVLLPDKIWRFVWRDDSAIEPVYMDGLFKHASVRAALSKMATGTSGSMKNISQSKLKTFPVPIPPLDLQRRFVEIVGAARALTREGESRTRVAAALLESLMSRLLQDHGGREGCVRLDSGTGNPVSRRDRYGQQRDQRVWRRSTIDSPAVDVTPDDLLRYCDSTVPTGF